MDYKVLTPEDIKNAKDYIPLEEKMKFIADVSGNCFDRLNISAPVEDDFVVLPSMYKENSEKKSRYLMGALAKMYFGFDFISEDETGYYMTKKDYDSFCGAHILNQIDRFKHDVSIRDKCFDIMSDFKELEKRLNTEVYGLLNTMNDSVSRIIATIRASFTPERMKAAEVGLKDIQDKITEYANNKKAE